MFDRDSDAKKDAFWDLEALLPPQSLRRHASTARSQSAEPLELSLDGGASEAVSAPTPAKEKTERDTETAEITLRAPKESSTFADVLFTEHPVTPHAISPQQEPAFAYEPKSSLIHAVRVYPWKSQYTYYDQFCKHALALRDREGAPCEQVDFFSYVPQYAQMSKAQLAYYFWWRSNFRAGKCLPAAFSYLLLYLYELINLGDAIPPAEGQACMLRLWLSYRETHPRLDALVREWLCDYSLIYKLDAPVLPQRTYRELLSGARLKEFYVPLSQTGDELTSAMLLFCNNYDYTKSKFYSEKTAELYHRILRGAIECALTELRARFGDALNGKAGKSTLSRDAFVGAICSYRKKYRVEVEYTSFSHTHELRYIVSDVLKYAENALRAAMGIRSKLSIYALDAELRKKLDAYFSHALADVSKKAKQKKAVQEMPDYEKRYELPLVAPSPERAAEIEAVSWETTKRLVEAFGAEGDVIDVPDVTEEAPVPVPAVQSQEAVLQQDFDTPLSQSAGEGSELVRALGELVLFLPLADRADGAAQREFAAKRHLMPDAIVDKINTVAGDIFGDILLEETESGVFSIIEDYREELLELGVLDDGN